MGADGVEENQDVMADKTMVEENQSKRGREVMAGGSTVEASKKTDKATVALEEPVESTDTAGGRGEEFMGKQW